MDSNRDPRVKVKKKALENERSHFVSCSAEPENTNSCSQSTDNMDKGFSNPDPRVKVKKKALENEKSHFVSCSAEPENTNSCSQSTGHHNENLDLLALNIKQEPENLEIQTPAVDLSSYQDAKPFTNCENIDLKTETLDLKHENTDLQNDIKTKNLDGGLENGSPGQPEIIFHQGLSVCYITENIFCQTRNKWLTSKDQLQEHMSGVGVDPGLNSLHPDNYQLRRDSHNADKVYKCYSSTMESMDTEESHTMIPGQTDRPGMCDVGTSTIESVSHLNIHNRVHRQETAGSSKISAQTYCPTIKSMLAQRGKQLYRCVLCGLRYKQAQALCYHMEIHNKKRTFKCDLCNNIFSTEQSLRVHIASHLPAPSIAPSQDSGQTPIFVRKLIPLTDTLAPKHSVDKTCDTDKLFKCVACDKGFKRRKFLENHMSNHFNSKPFKCSVCEKGFKFELNSTKHMKSSRCSLTGKGSKRKRILKKPILATQVGKNESLCLVCGSQFPEKQTLKKHMLSHQRPFQCSVCDKMFKSRNVFKNHMLYHSEKYNCTLCKKSFRRRSALKEHLLIHCDQCPYKCGVCDKGFVKSGLLTSHMFTHADEHPFKCSVCDETLRQPSDFINHMPTHPDINLCFKCCLCEETFKLRSELKEHLLTHSIQNNFKCTLCGKRFHHLRRFQNHKSLYCKRPSLNCILCDEKFTLKEKWKEHMRTHIVRHKCGVCGKGFKQKLKWKRHMRLSNYADTLIQCSVCDQRFCVRQDFKRHLLTHPS